jgi:Flp pilus assembly pilin Flp
MERLKKFWKDQGGVTAASFGMVVALVAAALILTLAAVRG